MTTLTAAPTVAGPDTSHSPAPVAAFTSEVTDELDRLAAHHDRLARIGSDPVNRGIALGLTEAADLLRRAAIDGQVPRRD